jgi:hypothetical protein
MTNPSIFVPASRPCYTVDYSDLERFIADTYEVPNFEITEMDNDSTIACDTDLKYFDSTDESEARALIQKGWCCEYQVNNLIRLLYKDGHITDGDYNVDVCW